MKINLFSCTTIGLRTGEGLYGHQNSIGGVGIPDKISTNIRAPWKGSKVWGPGQNGPLFLWRMLCSAVPTHPTPPKMPVHCGGNGSYEVLQKILEL